MRVRLIANWKQQIAEIPKTIFTSKYVKSEFNVAGSYNETIIILEAKKKQTIVKLQEFDAQVIITVVTIIRSTFAANKHFALK